MRRAVLSVLALAGCGGAWWLLAGGGPQGARPDWVPVPPDARLLGRQGDSRDGMQELGTGGTGPEVLAFYRAAMEAAGFAFADTRPGGGLTPAGASLAGTLGVGQATHPDGRSLSVTIRAPRQEVGRRTMVLLSWRGGR